jgi:hypothetical protein
MQTNEAAPTGLRAPTDWVGSWAVRLSTAGTFKPYPTHTESRSMEIRRTLRALASASILALTAGCGVLAMPAAATNVVTPLPASDYGTRDLCAEPSPGHAACMAVELVPKTTAARARTHPLGVTKTHPIKAAEAAEGVYGFTPHDLHSGYQLPTEEAEPQSNPQTIGIVDAYDDANVEADLEVYDQEFGLPACTSANGCFRKVNQTGHASPLPESSSSEAKGWAGEIATDVELAHAVCEDCHILLVEAKSAENINLDTAEDKAVTLGATEVSDSWGGPESSGEANTAFEHPGTVITVAAGDNGYLDWDSKESGHADYPATSPNVVAVGGTRLILNAGGGTWHEETVWNGDGATGGGCSTLFTAQPWQPSASVGCGTKRAVADVSADGDPYTGVAVYDSTPNPAAENSFGWGTIGGTSVASPIIASVFALAGGSHKVEYPAETLYANLAASPSALHDVISGSNGFCGKPFNSEEGPEAGLSGCEPSTEAVDCLEKAICNAITGYDGPSGVGTPNGIAAFQLTSAQRTREEAKEKEKTGEGSEEPGETTGGGGGGEPSEHQEPGTTGPGPLTPTPSGGGGNGSSASTGISFPLASSITTASNQTGVNLSGLALTVSAISALNHAHPRVSAIGFSFLLSVPAQVRVSLSKEIEVRRHTRWKTLPGSFTLSAQAGLDRARLRGRRTLGPGRYRLTCTPVHHTRQALEFVLG